MLPTDWEKGYAGSPSACLGLLRRTSNCRYAARARFLTPGSVRTSSKGGARISGAIGTRVGGSVAALTPLGLRCSSVEVDSVFICTHHQRSGFKRAYQIFAAFAG